jgi:FkbM family methyltransferase
LLKRLKQELARLLSTRIAIRLDSGLYTGARLYGNLFINRQIAARGLNQEESLYQRLDLSNRTIIEAGAHIGYYTVYFARRFPSARIHAFEPNPHSYRLLLKNLRINEIQEQVSPCQCGLAESNEDRSLVMDRYTTATSRFDIDGVSPSCGPFGIVGTHAVPVKSLDAVAEQENIHSVDFVKIDVEGYEQKVLEGMRNVLRIHSPLIYFELHGETLAERQTRLRAILNLLYSLDYRVHQLQANWPEVAPGPLRGSVSTGGYIAHRANSWGRDHLLSMMSCNEKTGREGT